MNKSEVCVKLTRKNCKKVLGILEMFGEECPYPERNLTDELDKYNLFHYSGFSEYWCVAGTNLERLNKTIIKPRELRNILAKEHLKVGDVVNIETLFSQKKIVEVTDIDRERFSFKSVDRSLLGSYHIDELEFLRYATDEEKAMLEPEKPITFTREIWVNHYSDREFYPYHTKVAAESCRRVDGQTVKATLTYDIPMTKV